MFLEIAFSTSKLPEILSYHFLEKPASKMGKLAGLIWTLASRMGKPEKLVKEQFTKTSTVFETYQKLISDVKKIKHIT